jgi:hypothetical protein
MKSCSKCCLTTIEKHIEFLCDTEEEAHLMIRNHVKFARAAVAADRARRPVAAARAGGELTDGELADVGSRPPLTGEGGPHGRLGKTSTVDGSGRRSACWA